MWATWSFTAIRRTGFTRSASRFRKVHLKDFKVLTKGFSPFQAEFVNLGDGDIDWSAVRQAFADVGYTGWTTTELEGGDEAYLRDVAKRVDG